MMITVVKLIRTVLSMIMVQRLMMMDMTMMALMMAISNYDDDVVDNDGDDDCGEVD